MRVSPLPFAESLEDATWRRTLRSNNAVCGTSLAGAWSGLPYAPISEFGLDAPQRTRRLEEPYDAARNAGAATPPEYARHLRTWSCCSKSAGSTMSNAGHGAAMPSTSRRPDDQGRRNPEVCKERRAHARVRGRCCFGPPVTPTIDILLLFVVTPAFRRGRFRGGRSVPGRPGRGTGRRAPDRRAGAIPRGSRRPRRARPCPGSAS